nr:MAG TPA: hypothetical protein [Caudoviricetes sp.]
MKIRAAAAWTYKKYLTIRINTIYSVALDTKIITSTRHGSRFYILHISTPFTM